MSAVAAAQRDTPLGKSTAARRLLSAVAAHVVFCVGAAVSFVCVAALGSLALFDAQAARLTSGTTPPQFARPLAYPLSRPRHAVTVVAHNAGDNLRDAANALAYGADAIEIDVRSSPDGLLAAHDAPLPLLEPVAFRGPSFTQAWDIARERGTVLLHLKQGSPAFIARVAAVVEKRPPRRLIIQTSFADSLPTLGRLLPQAEVLLLVFQPADLARLRSDAGLRAQIDGVSVRETLLTGATQAWLHDDGLATFAWSVDDEAGLQELIRHGVDGVITDRLDIMRALA